MGKGGLHPRAGAPLAPGVRAAPGPASGQATRPRGGRRHRPRQRDEGKGRAVQCVAARRRPWAGLQQGRGGTGGVRDYDDGGDYICFYKLFGM